MADCNGLNILQDIRNRFYDMPVILATAHDSSKEDMKSIEADFYVVKSFDLTELKQKIAMALETTSPVDNPALQACLVGRNVDNRLPDALLRFL